MENDDNISAEHDISGLSRTGTMSCGTKDDHEYCYSIAERYRSDVEILARYVPWLESKLGQDTSKSFEGDDLSSNSMTFPVYDGTLISFVKDAQRTTLISRNYFYIYSRNKIRSAEDEKKLISSSDITEMDNITGILSKYICEGMTKGRVWSEGVRNGIYLCILKKMQENIDMWDRTPESK